MNASFLMLALTCASCATSPPPAPAPAKVAAVAATPSPPAAPRAEEVPTASASKPAPAKPTPAKPAPAPSPVKAADKPAPAPAAPKKEAVAKAPAAPHLDLKTLEQRLKGTRAIGTFTKLSLKNDVDDLLDQFREYYAGRLQTTLAALRRPYELLMMKVLSLLQNDDPQLADDIARSRETIWGVLSDKNRFATL